MSYLLKYTPITQLTRPGLKLIETLCWLVLALIHALPALAFFTPSLITRLYGAEPGSQVFLLMQHRAALFCSVFEA